MPRFKYSDVSSFVRFVAHAVNEFCAHVFFLHWKTTLAWLYLEAGFIILGVMLITRNIQANAFLYCATGVYSVHCDVPNQTVTVSGNIAPQALLKRVKHVKRKSKILSYSSPYTSSVTSYGASSYGSAYHRPARYTLSPPRDHSYYSRNNQHTFAHPVGYHDQRRPSHDHHYSNYY